jgi:hypothetical protein
MTKTKHNSLVETTRDALRNLGLKVLVRRRKLAYGEQVYLHVSGSFDLYGHGSVLSLVQRNFPEAYSTSSCGLRGSQREAVIALGKPTRPEPKSAPKDNTKTRWVAVVTEANWRKGKIVAEWLDAHPSKTPMHFAQHVNSITAEHVNRLVEVWRKFNTRHILRSYLSWAHFNVALEWADADDWLILAARESWDVPTMRKQRFKEKY